MNATVDRDPSDLGLAPLPPAPAHDCRDGWIGDDSRPTPCPRCKPHLRREADRSGLVARRASRTTTDEMNG